MQYIDITQFYSKRRFAPDRLMYKKVHVRDRLDMPLTEEPVNRLVAGSNPARGANYIKDLPT
jgi:hypothetical protein